ncbi:MAG: hypothetical protein WC848_06450 [Parcubacteria group bacterium]|jgi:hypothetical protein
MKEWKKCTLSLVISLIVFVITLAIALAIENLEKKYMTHLDDSMVCNISFSIGSALLAFVLAIVFLDIRPRNAKLTRKEVG